MVMTITEALAEIKLITNKLMKKKEWCVTNVVRFKHAPDPYADKGGTKVVMSQELQSIEDLEGRIAAIRTAIMKANLENTADVMGTTKTIYEWLVWRKEIASNKRSFLQQIYSTAKNSVDRHAASPQVCKSESGVVTLVEMEVNVDYGDYNNKAAYVLEVFDKLDGILSLKNATITIEA